MSGKNGLNTFITVNTYGLYFLFGMTVPSDYLCSGYSQSVANSKALWSPVLSSVGTDRRPILSLVLIRAALVMLFSFSLADVEE